MKKKIKAILSSHWYRLIIAAVILVLGGIIRQNTNDSLYIGISFMCIAVAVFAVYFVVMMYFAITGTISDNKK